MNDIIKKRIADINSGKVPEGYKKTKVGIVPVEWETVRLKNISKHSTEKNKDLKYHETYSNSATQGIIKQTDYFDKQISNSENIDGYYVVRQNDYVYNPRISVSAPCGPINKSHFSETGVMSPLYTVFRLNDEYKENGYIEHYFKSPFWYRYMSSVANYGARHDRMNITNDDLFNMPISFPPLPEQQKIAEILSTQDKLIELQEKKIEQLKKLKKAYLQKMFPKKGSKYPEIRFKGFTDPWEQRKLGDHSEIVAGGTPNTGYPEYWNPKEIPWMSSGEINNKVIYSTDNMISKIGFSNSSAKWVKEKSVLIALAGQGKTRGTVAISEIPLTTNQSIAAIQPDSFLYYKFLFQNLEGRYNELREVSSGDGTRGGLNKQIISDLVVLAPEIQEQIKIGDFLCDIDTLITLHQRKLEQEKQKKKALMQLLLTGKVRVKI